MANKKRTKVKKLFIILSVFIVAVGCDNSLSNETISCCKWKYSDGFRISDLIVVRDSVINDTLYDGDKAVATIEKIVDRGIDKELHIKSIKNNENGRYVSKGELK